MAWVKIPVQEQWTNANDVNASGFVIKCYLPGTTTVTPMAIDKNGVTTVTTATLNADGFPEVSGNEVALYIDRDFKIAIYQNASDAAANTNAFWGPVDNVKINSLLSNFQDGYWLADYTALRAINPANYSADDIITVTNSGIAGEGVLRNVTSHGLSDNGGTIIVINSNWYWERMTDNCERYFSKWWEFDTTGNTNDSSIFSAFLSACKSAGVNAEFGVGRYRSDSTITWPIGVSIFGQYSKIGTQASPLTAFVCTASNPSGWQIDGEQTSGSGYQNATLEYITFVAEGAAQDDIQGLRIRGKGARVYKCNFINLTTGIKNQAVENWICENYFNSCGTCIDESGGECHIFNNHGFPENIAILLRLNNSLVQGNKFFGDGSGADYGIEIWGYGNQIIGNVFDAFLEAAYYLHSNSAGQDVANNTIIGNAYGTGINGTSTVGAAVYMNATNANIYGNNISVSCFNFRGDRSPTYMYRMVAVGASTISKNLLGGSVVVSHLPSAANVLSKNGAGVLGDNRINNIAGFTTARHWAETVSNGTIVNHLLDITPTAITITASDNNTSDVGYQTVTSTTFQVLLRDNSGAATVNKVMYFTAERLFA